MTVLPDLRRLGVHVLAPLVAVAALLAACGGGTSQVEDFKPTRLVVLGDENGVLVDDGNHDGFKYSVNDRLTDTTVTNTDGTTSKTGQCRLHPTPSQYIAEHYGFVYEACNPQNKTAAQVTFVEVKAQAGALTDDATSGLKAQVDTLSGLQRTTLIMVQIGTNDVIDLYNKKAAGTLTASQAVAEATRRGDVAAVQINRLLGAGARALVFTVPVLGKSPFAIEANKTDSGAAALITSLTAAFNTALRLGIDATDFDGRNYGLVLADDVVAAMERFPTSYLTSPANTTTALCTLAAMPTGCVTAIDTDPDANVDNSIKAITHLWASDRHLGAVANLQIANQALSRAINNPF